MGTAVLVLDYQNRIINNFTDTVKARVLGNAQAVLSSAREATMPVIHVVVRFRAGHPEVNPRNVLFSNIQKGGAFVEGDPATDEHETIRNPSEAVITKRRVSAFHNTELDVLLRAKAITKLVVLGLTTGGAVLSTLIDAYDADYDITVIEDACADADEENHKNLFEKVFKKRGMKVVTAATFVDSVKTGAN